jgi:hypothetical protein
MQHLPFTDRAPASAFPNGGLCDRDWPLYSRGVYSADQATAERASAGIWAGSFIEPWKYRGCIRAGGRPQACSDGD